MNRFKFYISNSIRFCSLLLLAGLLLTSCSESKPETEEQTNPGIFEVFANSDKIIELNLMTNLDSLILNRNTLKDQDAILTFNDGTQTKSWEIEVEARGKTRKNYCDVPPIKLKFPKKLLREQGFATFKSIKLVSPCKGSENYQDLVLREYLSYKLYNQLTDNSFRVQLANVILTDSEDTSKVQRNLAFMLEPVKSLGQRLDAQVIKSEEKVKTLNKNSYSLMTLFQYMIGNTDWNIGRQHNIKMVNTLTAEAPVPIPYDFDYCGLVNAEYARPHQSLPIKNIRERLFQCRVKEPTIVDNNIEIFKAKKESIQNYVSGFELLGEESRQDILAYISSFYDIIESPDYAKALENSKFAAKKATFAN